MQYSICISSNHSITQLFFFFFKSSSQFHITVQSWSTFLSFFCKFVKSCNIVLKSKLWSVIMCLLQCISGQYSQIREQGVGWHLKHSPGNQISQACMHTLYYTPPALLVFKIKSNGDNIKTFRYSYLFRDPQPRHFVIFALLVKLYCWSFWPKQDSKKSKLVCESILRE